MLHLLAQTTLGFGSWHDDDHHDPCECTGNHGKGPQQYYYPSDIGNYCESWDQGMDYCKDGGSSEGADWCPKKWCYVDAACDDAAAGSYLSDISGPALSYSYGACGATDTYTGTEDDPLA